MRRNRPSAKSFVPVSTVISAVSSASHDQVHEYSSMFVHSGGSEGSTPVDYDVLTVSSYKAKDAVP